MYLNCKSWYSLRYGVLSPTQLVERAHAHQIEALALTDIHNSAGVVEFVRECRHRNIHPVVGMEFRQAGRLNYIALAANTEGFREINDFYARHQYRGRDFPELAPRWDHVYTVYPWARRNSVTLGENEFLGVRPNELPQLVRSRFRQRPDRLVMRQPITFTDKTGYNTHRLLRAIDRNCLLKQLAPQHQANSDELALSPDQLRGYFSEYPQIIKNTERLLRNCQFDLAFGRDYSRTTYTGVRYDDMLLLEKLAREGAERRYGGVTSTVKARLEKELRVIAKQNFGAYFLITWDFVRYAKSRGFAHVGRGSGANSLVAYCIGLSDVDPLELGLYFERFLNEHRSAPPDFDIDFAHDCRDDVTDYILKRWGRRHTALLSAHATFQPRAAMRELGKVFGLPKADIDRMILDPPKRTEGLRDLHRLVIRYSHRLQDMPSHLSIHAGGILISEQPMHQFCGTQMMPKGFAVTHTDMYQAEEISLHKFDVLSQRGLSHMQEAVSLIRRNRGVQIDLQDVGTFKRDEKVRQLVSSGRTMGCFYVESPAMRGLLTKLRCQDYATLVAASSVIRPGVARSGMMRAYIERHRGVPHEVLHPIIGEVLKETYGIMVYQEDVLKVAHEFAGLTLAEGDLLRRAMSGKTRGSRAFGKLRRRFFANCAQKGYDAELTEEVWRQIESFAGYSFCKAHSASFAVESYQDLYLKAHFPLEFMVGVINNEGGFYDTEIYLHEARRAGGKVHPPCLNHSRERATLRDRNIYLGFGQIKGLSRKVVASILAERDQNGAFRDLVDLLRRVPLTIEQAILLIRVGALAFSGRSKPELLWEARFRCPKYRRKNETQTLFSLDARTPPIPKLTQNQVADAYDEWELLGFPLSSPFDLVEHTLDTPTARDLPKLVGRTLTVAGYYVCAKTTRTVNGKLMRFSNFLDLNGDFIDVVIFPDLLSRLQMPARAVYLLEGVVTEDFGAYGLTLKSATQVDWRPDPRF